MWVIAIIGLGQRFLSFNKPFLKAVNEAIYPFYILHQTAIVGIGYYVIQWHLSMGPKFVLTSTLAGVASIALYLTLIRPFNFTRLLFGMKPIAGKSAVAEAKKTVGPVCAAWRLARQFERDF